QPDESPECSQNQQQEQPLPHEGFEICHLDLSAVLRCVLFLRILFLPSLLQPLLLHDPLSIFTRSLERKFMFLVCNGILAFLAKSSCSSSSSSPSGSDLDGDDELFRKKDRSAWDDLPEDEIKVSASGSSEVEAVTAEDAATTGYNEYQENNLVLAAEEGEEEGEEEDEKLQVQGKDTEEEDEAEQQEEQILQDTGAEDENETWVVEDDDRHSKQEEEELEERGYMGKEPESPAVATGSEEMMSTEELNKKFEEFIRKMKEEIRIEAKSQLIAV
ncbi:glutamic acid-rich protein-like, partial [Eucalyptus grandis]|uniref:glutamic acid-rich protein-like n=1 Tax=Eucalyptus grandis TaxID=71139 RepID=UPI00192EDEDD